nr:MAG TPA: hypothetical protein [Caudoviricetes sp.]
MTYYVKHDIIIVQLGYARCSNLVDYIDSLL